MGLKIRKLNKNDAVIISQAFSEIGWNKPTLQYENYYSEQCEGKRVVLVALLNGKFAGYLTIVWQSGYPYFKENNIPEIMDLNVLPKYRRQKIATKLMDEAEKIVSNKSKIIGIGVGLAPGYNAAQRMYVLRGYIPDGLGVTYKGKYVRHGQKIIANDSLILYLTKKLK
ncbi:MAG: GNAT family N-acetyltransferase [Candidatus Edwardsbacteria bacterium]